MAENDALTVNNTDFDDARWQEQNAITSFEKLVAHLSGFVSHAVLSDIESGLCHAPMAMRITPYLTQLIEWERFQLDPIRRQFIPMASEFKPSHPLLRLDSLREQEDSPVEGLVHRYPDRALFLATDRCPVYCRFCTRSYSVGIDTETVVKRRIPPTNNRWEAVFAFLKQSPQIVDVVVSGGDCFRLKPAQIRAIGQSLLSIQTIRRIRFASKGLAVMPMKITSDPDWTNALCEVSDAGREAGVEVSLHTHFNHPREITSYATIAAKLLFRRGVMMRNQSVLLAGVNDDDATMSSLVKQLSDIHVHPYYVYACDLAEGLEDMRVPIKRACEIEKSVRGLTAGYNTPTFVVDTPGGGGKRDVHSFEHYDSRTGIAVYTSPSVKPGKRFIYPDPLHTLTPEIRDAWLVPFHAQRMLSEAIEAATYKAGAG